MVLLYLFDNRYSEPISCYVFLHNSNDKIPLRIIHKPYLSFTIDTNLIHTNHTGAQIYGKFILMNT